MSEQDYSRVLNGSHEVKEERLIRADSDSVFVAFTDEKLLSTWFTSHAKVDLRVGGEYSNGDHDRGIYLKIDRPRRLRFTWENPQHCPGTEIDITFDQAGDRLTTVTLRHRNLGSEEYAAHMRSGWAWALDNVKLFLETGQTVSYEAWQSQRH
jgi:uncharacterized protein YndB with AHSA1/START domain